MWSSWWSLRWEEAHNGFRRSRCVFKDLPSKTQLPCIASSLTSAEHCLLRNRCCCEVDATSHAWLFMLQQVRLGMGLHRSGVGNLWLASQMWFFWWRHLARLIFSWHDGYEWNFFCNFPSTRLQSHQQRHAAPEVALTVRSMLLRENSDICHCLKLLVLLENAHVS